LIALIYLFLYSYFSHSASVIGLKTCHWNFSIYWQDLNVKNEHNIEVLSRIWRFYA